MTTPELVLKILIGMGLGGCIYLITNVILTEYKEYKFKKKSRSVTDWKE